MLRPSVRSPLLAAALLAAIPAALSAQEVRVYSSGPGERVAFVTSDRLMLGITTSSDSERADTLGLLIEEVREDSPAGRAGLKRGERIQSINGVNLRAGRDDAGTEEYEGVLSRRLTREMGKVKEGDEVELRIYGDGRTRTVKVKPVKSSELSSLARSMSRLNDRPVLGLTIGSTGSPRDTLGVFVSSVVSDGPADKAGVVEGDRIAAINGISVRVAREDAEDRAVAAAKADRLRREIERLTVGTAAELTIISAGRSRTVRVTPVKASDLGGEYTFDVRTAVPLMRQQIERMQTTRPRVMWTPEAAPIPPTPATPPSPPVAPTARTYRSRIVTI